MSKSATDTEADTQSSGLSAGKKDAIAGGVGVVAGLDKFRDIVPKTCYEQFKGTWQELIDERNSRKKLENAVKAKGGGPAEYVTIKKEFKDKVKQIFKNDRQFKGHSDYWKTLTDSNKREVVERAFTTGAIATAVGLAIVNADAISKLFSRHSKDEGAER